MKKVIVRYYIGLQVCVFAVVLLCVSAAVRAAYAAEQEFPCAGEIAMYCKDVKPGGGRLLNCLNEHQKDLSVSCRNKLEESKKRLMEVQQACTEDMEKFCKDVQPGGGRILKCLREHVQDLSPACREIAGKIEEKAQEKKESRQ